ncbi:MAG: TolC family outer membrane protein [Geminicoccaceae bacterium]
MTSCSTEELAKREVATLLGVPLPADIERQPAGRGLAHRHAFTLPAGTKALVIAGDLEIAAPVALGDGADRRSASPFAAAQSEPEPPDPPARREASRQDTEASVAESPRPEETEPPPIRLADAVEQAIARNPDVRIELARLEDAVFGIDEARGALRPRVDLRLAVGPEHTRPETNQRTDEMRQEANITVRQLLYDFGLTQEDVRRTEFLADSARARTLGVVEGVTLEVANAFLGVLEGQELLDVARENEAAHEAILKLVKTSEAGGNASKVDVSRVSARLADASSLVFDRESQLDQARDSYRRLLRELPGPLLEPELDLSELPLDSEEAIARAELSNPELMALLADERSLRRQLSSQLGNFFPKFEFELQGNSNVDVGGHTGENQDIRGMLQMRYNLYRGGSDKAIAGQLRARIRETSLRRTRELEDVEREIRNGFSAIEASRQKRRTLEEGVEASSDVARLYVEQFKAGRRTVFDLLDSQRDLFTARRDAITNRFNELRSAFGVLQNLGRLYPAITGAAGYDVDTAARHE